MNENWQTLAHSMVAYQLRTRDIVDERVLRVMERTPRHLFVPEGCQEEAYDDGPLSIGRGQTISQPYIVALMTQLLDLKGHETILEIGTGSGYQTAVLSQLVSHVYSLELIQSLSDQAGTILKERGHKNVTLACGDGYKGWREEAPFDGIIVTAAPEEVPDQFIEQLCIGGRLVIPVGAFSQKLELITKTDPSKTKKRYITGVRFVPMVYPDQK